MKLPVVWVVSAFTAGIALALRAGPPWLLWWCAGAAALAISLGFVLVWRKSVAAAGATALVAWAALGGLATMVERQAGPANDVTRLIAQGRVDTTEPLRWRGRLRENPLDLPWGRRYEIELEEVEVAGRSVSASGGLRLNLYGRASVAQSPNDLRAGDRVEALALARPPRNFLDPGAFDFQGYLARQGIDLTGTLRSGELLQLVDRPPPGLWQRLARARANLLARLESLFPGQTERAAALRAMLLGDRSFVDSEAVTAFQKTAVYHVLVVAGLHVGALAVFVYWLCRRLRFPMGLTSLATATALVAYVAVVQDRPPILRAGLVAVVYVIARWLFRRVEMLNTVALAALTLLFVSPSFLGDSSFQLSFLAAGVIAGLALPWIERTSAPYRTGLRHLSDVTRDGSHSPRAAQFRLDMRAANAWLAPRLTPWLARRSETLLTLPVRVALRLWEIVLLSAVIQWGMMPLLARDFHRVSLGGPLANIPAVILTGIIVPLGFLTLAATFVWVRLAAVCANMLGRCVGLLLAIVEWFSRLPHLSYRIPGPPVWLIAAFLVVLAILAATARVASARREKQDATRQGPPPTARGGQWAAAALVVLTILVAWHPFAPVLAQGKLEADVLDVGQGDSIFVVFPGGETMLVDGGGLAGSEWIGGYRSGIDVGEEVVSPYLWSRGLKRLDVVALTHAHHDHLGGLHSVLENFRVGQLWIGRDEDTPAFRGLLAEARARGLAIVHKAQGAGFEWSGVRGEALWPPDAGPVGEASNDDSLVLRLSDGRVRLLLPGDIQERVEDKLVADHAPLRADFLKVPHHGSKTSSTEEFLSAVAPTVAVVSVGQGNPFGQPAENVLNRYQHAGVHLLRTDRDGAVFAVTDGRELVVHSFAENGAH